MAQAHAFHGASKDGLKLIPRDDVTLISTVKAKPGGFAIVHQGIFNGEVVAVKIPRDACSLTEKQFKELIREMTIMASVKHPHCVTLLAACEDRTNPLLVMEWLSGGNLFEALGRDDPNALPWHVRLRIAREIASAIEFLHRCKISHGDLKSMNVLLTSDLVSKICDFGAAIHRLSTTAMMSSKTDGTLQYTLHYSAPELLKTGLAANAETDMYAFGIIMYELLTCKIPFDGVNPALLRDLIVKEGLRPDVPDPHTSQFPPAFFDVMQLCWHQDPALRPTAEAAHQFLISIDPSARPSAPLVLYPMGHPAPRGSVLDYIRAAMPASSAVNDMLSKMMSRADSMFKSDVEVQSLCAKYSIFLAEAHSIMIYTMDGQQFDLSTEDSPYFHFNSTCRNRDAAAVERWADFSCLFCSALDKLPSKKITVFRGLNVPLSQVSHEYKANKVVWLVSVTSTTSDEKDTLQSFGTGANSRPGTLMKIRALFAKDIRAFSMFKKESEWLLAPNTCLSIEKVFTSQDLADMKGLGVPENVDLIYARQQQVSAEDILAAQENDKSDLAAFKTQQFLIRPSASKSSSILAPVSPKSPVSTPPSANARAAAIAWCAATARRSSIAQELQALQRIVSRIGDARYVSDDAAPSCTICKKAFGVFLRRHHCLVCGIVACDDCSKDKKRGCMKCEQWSGICQCQTPRIESLRMCLTCNSNDGISAATSLLLDSEQAESACILAAEHTLTSHGLGSDTRSLLTAGCSLSDLQGAGADTSLSSLMAAGCDARILKDAGFSAKTLLDDGFRADSLVAAGYDVSQLLSLKVSASSLRSYGLPATQLLSAGCTYKELKVAGYSASELRSAGGAAAQLKASGFDAPQLAEAGFGPDEMKSAGFEPRVIRAAGFDLRILKKCGVFVKRIG